MDPEAQKRQRRGRRMMWILVGVMIALPIGGMLYATFGPNPPIIISKATTHITAPLDADGLPDYAAAIRTHIQRDTTPDENGAIPFLQAMWPKQDEDSSPEDDRLVCTELGLSYPPPQNLRISSYDTKAMRLKALRHYRNRVTQVDFSSAPETETHEYEDVLLGYSMNEAAFWSANEDVAIDDERVNDLLYQALSNSWTPDDLPFVAAWLDENEVGFHLLVEATEKPRWYLPEAELLGPAGKRESLLGIAMSSLTQVRQAARYLAIQMGRSQGRGDYANAARYALSVLRLASHLSSEPYLVDHLVAVAIESVGIGLVQRLAADAQTSRAVLVQLQEELKQIGRPNALARLDLVGERYFSLHEALRTSQYGIEPTDSELTGIDWPLDSLQGLANGFSVDWNEVLIAINKQYDGIAAAIALPTRAQRLAALSAIDTRMTARSNRLGQRWREPRRFLSTKARGQLIADGYLTDSFFSYANLASIDDRGQTSHDLTRLIIALAIYRVEQGVYPTSLKALKPNILSTLPVDPFNAKPYAYRRTDDGFLLYSLGQNGIDDGGSFADDGMGNMKYEGIAIDSMLDPLTDTLTPEEQAAYDLIDQIPAGADDVSLRVPLPVEPWPWEE